VIRRHAWTSFTLRDIHQSIRNTTWVKDAKTHGVEAVAAELTKLVEYGHIRPADEPHEGPGRKPSPRYEVHPNHAPTDRSRQR
ncbi:MAG: hypothetical protein ACRDP4_14455, partial [Nocardioidaceae bacterium]